MAAFSLAVCHEKQAAIREQFSIRLGLCTVCILSPVRLRKPNSAQMCWKHTAELHQPVLWQASPCCAGHPSPQVHRYCKISGRRNRVFPLLPANSRKSHGLSRWGLVWLATGDTSVCPVEQVLPFLVLIFLVDVKGKGRGDHSVCLN